MGLEPQSWGGSFLPHVFGLNFDEARHQADRGALSTRVNSCVPQDVSIVTTVGSRHDYSHLQLYVNVLE